MKNLKGNFILRDHSSRANGLIMGSLLVKARLKSFAGTNGQLAYELSSSRAPEAELWPLCPASKFLRGCKHRVISFSKRRALLRLVSHVCCTTDALRLYPVHGERVRKTANFYFDKVFRTFPPKQFRSINVTRNLYSAGN